MFLFAAAIGMNAQGSELYGSGLKVKFNEDGSKYLRVISWAQVWARYNVNNEGTTRNGATANGTFDIGLRRARMLFLSQISPKFLILAHFGINNQNAMAAGFTGGNEFKPAMFFHDVWTEYNLAKGKTTGGMAYELSIGGGLHYWNGISRMTNTSTLNFLTLDAPIVNWPTIDAADEFARMMGIYAKGKIEKLDYRVALNMPFAKQAASLNAATLPVGSYGYHAKNNSVNLQGYFNYQFLDQESNLLPFMVGTYLGTKKVFNIGAGFEHGIDAMAMKSSKGVVDSGVQAMTHFSVDAFLDMPLSSKKDAISAYAAYYNYNFGKDYVRNIGIMNMADGFSNGGATDVANKQGIGNSYPTVGTGQAVYAQVGYLLPKGKSSLRIQPYGNITLNNWDGVKNIKGEQVGWFANGNIGCNWLIEGHHAKITTDIGLRPDFNNTTNAKLKPCFTVQSMIYL